MSGSIYLKVALLSALAGGLHCFGCYEIPCRVCPYSQLQCRNKNCISKIYECDGVDNCGDKSDEYGCGNIPYKIETKSRQYSDVKTKLKSWLLTKRLGTRPDLWISQIHRIAVTLHLADNSTFLPGNSTGDEIRKELMRRLELQLTKDKKLSSEELALYIHALLVTCLDPKDFYGHNLVQELRQRVYASGIYTNPFLILVLCNAEDTMTAKDVDRVTTAFNSKHRPFWTESQALASMALACISSRNKWIVDKNILKDMLQKLKSQQFSNGTIHNFRATALVTQALFIQDSYLNDFNLDSALKILGDGVNKTKSLLKAYYALPIFNGKSLLNVTSGHCKKELNYEFNVDDFTTALQLMLNQSLDNGETFKVLFSVWMGEEVNMRETKELIMQANDTIYNAIEKKTKMSLSYKVHYNVVDGKPYVSSYNGKEEDPELGIYWFIYLKGSDSDEQPTIVEQSPVDVKLHPNQEIILWYKRGPWNIQSFTQNQVTNS